MPVYTSRRTGKTTTGMRTNSQPSERLRRPRLVSSRVGSSGRPRFTFHGDGLRALKNERHGPVIAIRCAEVPDGCQGSGSRSCARCRHDEHHQLHGERIAHRPSCSIAVAPTNLAFGEEGGQGTVTVTAPAGCPWSTTSSGSWIAVTDGASGTGPGSVRYSIVANATPDARAGSVTIGGQTHTVTQQGRVPATCSYAISPSAANFGKDEATGTFTVASQAECGWTATSKAPWLVVTGGHQGTGNGTVTYSITRNREVAERAASIAAGGLDFTVRQAGDVPAIECQVLGSSRDRDAVHAGWQPDGRGDDPGDMFVDRHGQCLMAGNSRRRIRHGPGRDHDHLLRQLRCTA